MCQHVPAFNPNSKPGQTYDDSIALIRDRAAFLSSEEKFAILELTAEDQLMPGWSKTGVYVAPEKLWLCTLMPRWEVVVDKSNLTQYFFVLSIVGEVCLLTCPVYEDDQGDLQPGVGAKGTLLLF